MGMLAKKLHGQSQQLHPTKVGAKTVFETSAKDIEVRGAGKEGSKKEEAFDRKQMMACGGKTKK